MDITTLRTTIIGMTEGAACDLAGTNFIAIRTSTRAGNSFHVEPRIRMDRLTITVVGGLVTTAIVN